MASDDVEAVGRSREKNAQGEHVLFEVEHGPKGGPRTGRRTVGARYARSFRYHGRKGKYEPPCPFLLFIPSQAYWVIGRM